MLLSTQALFAQSDSLARVNVFDRITKEIAAYKIDTTNPPDDKITKKINELRSLSGGFNINEAIAFKIEEDKLNKKMPEAELNKLSEFFSTGSGRRQLDNAITWIYRNHFTYKELKGAVNFYRTSAGQKMATNFPIIMLQSLAAAEMIRTSFSK